MHLGWASGAWFCSANRCSRWPAWVWFSSGWACLRGGVAGRRASREGAKMTEPTFSTAAGLKRQTEIYRQGLAGQTPAQAVCVEELEQQAKAVLKPEAYAYVA